QQITESMQVILTIGTNPIQEVKHLGFRTRLVYGKMKVLDRKEPDVPRRCRLNRGDNVIQTRRQLLAIGNPPIPVKIKRQYLKPLRGSTRVDVVRERKGKK